MRYCTVVGSRGRHGDELLEWFSCEGVPVGVFVISFGGVRGCTRELNV